MIDLQPNLELTSHQAEQLLGTWSGGPVVCTDIVKLEGGMVNTAYRLEFDRAPHRAVVKLHRRDSDGLAAEARALEYLAAETACPVPRVYVYDGSARLIPYTFLLLELVPGVCLKDLELDPTERAEIDAQLADMLGELHNHTRSTWGAIDADDEPRSWAELFEVRLRGTRAQATVAERLTPEVLAQVDQAIDLARSMLGDSGTPTLVHGDIWDGNMMVRLEDGHWRLTGLLDPSLEFADVEFELAYLEVFDTSRQAFLAAYAAHHAVRPGYERRRLFYWLHTALVHVALFGDEFFCRFTERTAAEICRLQAH